jgi:hypothetical protein
MGRNLGTTQRYQAFNYQGNGNDGGQKQGIDGPTGSLNNFNHVRNPRWKINPGFCLASGSGASGNLSRPFSGKNGLSPKAVDKSVNEGSSTLLTPFWQRTFPALPKNKAHRLSNEKSIT